MGTLRELTVVVTGLRLISPLVRLSFLRRTYIGCMTLSVFKNTNKLSLTDFLVTFHLSTLQLFWTHGCISSCHNQHSFRTRQFNSPSWCNFYIQREELPPRLRFGLIDAWFGWSVESKFTIRLKNAFQYTTEWRWIFIPKVITFRVMHFDLRPCKLWRKYFPPMSNKRHEVAWCAIHGTSYFLRFTKPTSSTSSWCTHSHQLRKLQPSAWLSMASILGCFSGKSAIQCSS